jgi:hypothetical protein
MPPKPTSRVLLLLIIVVASARGGTLMLAAVYETTNADPPIANAEPPTATPHADSKLRQQRRTAVALRARASRRTLAAQ